MQVAIAVIVCGYILGSMAWNHATDTETASRFVVADSGLWDGLVRAAASCPKDFGRTIRKMECIISDSADIISDPREREEVLGRMERLPMRKFTSRGRAGLLGYLQLIGARQDILRECSGFLAADQMAALREEWTDRNIDALVVKYNKGL